jgi:hypothetical protein
MGLEIVGRPQPMHRRVRQAGVAGHAAATPALPALGRLHHFGQHALNFVAGQREGATGPGRLLQPRQAQVQHSLSPLTDGDVPGVQ